MWQVWEQTGQGWGAASKLEVVPRETAKMEKQKYARLKKNQNKKWKSCGTAIEIATQVQCENQKARKEKKEYLKP